ncbi:von Willebrand factor A domain-containing protein 9 [Liparis tanakae]|uniref:Integrator complex subunit 14 n=1 Tax=Liparis tanakae TaxID=230148 RepID=A0A4Z2JB95_9TELE|nr:von Willebrand factor A domain-containing protein 9 [Liparis tanakae]
MPTVVLMDVSLSMTRPVSLDGSDEFQRKNLAVHGLNMLFEHMASNYRLEFTSLMAFSSLWELLVPFTRDYNALQEALSTLEDYDKTCVEAALNGVSNVVQQEWGSACPCQVVLVTDGSLGIGKGSLRHSLQTRKHRGDDKKFPLPFPFPTKLFIMSVANAEELQMTDAMDNLEELLRLSGGDGQIFTMEGPLCMKSVQAMFGRLIDHAYSPFHAVLHCGNLSSDVQVFPRPEPIVMDEEVEPMPRSVNIEVDEVGTGATDELEEEPSASQMAGKSPNFCVLLHGSLKVEGMVALVQLGPEWYGMLYSQADSKKKSNLMMSLFEPGPEPLPWLGKITHLGPISEAAENPYGEDDSKSPFPLQPSAKRSYAQNVTVWIKASGLQTDVQKILRNARKLPDKTQTFYKELNRLRKAALAFGFWELLKGVADLLERECTLLPDSAHPDAAFQLSHAAQQLKLASTGDSQYAAFDHNIAPMHTDFSS